jgi:hypothetical protein
MNGTVANEGLADLRPAAEKKIELATTSLAADTKLVAFLRRRLGLYRLFGLPPPPDVAE